MNLSYWIEELWSEDQEMMSRLTLPERETINALERQLIERGTDSYAIYITIRTVRSVMLNKYPVMKKTENRVVSLTKSECDTLLPDACGICMENHRKRETVLCGCEHAFGEECLNKWKETCNRSMICLTCPLCRQHVVKTTRFTESPPIVE